MTTGLDIAVCAQAYLSTPFAHGQRTRSVGIDCAGLIVCAHNDAGLVVEDVVDYGRQSDKRRYLALLRARFDEDIRQRYASGVVLSFAFGTTQMHLGIVVTDTLFVHSLSGHGVILSTYPGVWESRCRSMWRYRGVHYG